MEAFKSQPRQILLATGTAMMCMVLTYVGGTYLVGYGTHTLELSSTSVLSCTMLGGVTISIGVVVGGLLSDRIGRRWVIVGTACVAIVWTLMLFPILEHRSLWAFAVGVPVTMFISGVATGPLGAFLSELFHTRFRYTAAGFSYSLAAMLGGAIPPLVAPLIIQSYGGFAFGVLMAAVCILSLVCVLAIGETRQQSLEDDTALTSA
ncbi:MFS transporter [Tsukamurella soli]|uniref:MFS transporter n=1 Tax=Tsukamurella soli TaxID=644556 RepID=UPI00360C4256